MRGRKRVRLISGSGATHKGLSGRWEFIGTVVRMDDAEKTHFLSYCHS